MRFVMKHLILMRGVTQMNFKKLVCLTIAFAMAFAPVVGAQDDICSSCKSPKNILEFVQNQAGCEPISYENQAYGGLSSRWGYTAVSQNTTAKLIVKVCNCPNTSTYFKMNNIIGIRLTILTDGVYWTDDPMVVQPFASEADACAASIGLPGTLTVAQDGVVGPSSTVAGTTATPVNAAELPGAALPNIRYNAAGDVLNPASQTPKIFLPPMAILNNTAIPSEGYDLPYEWVGGLGNAQPDFRPAGVAAKRVNPLTDLVKYTYYRADGVSKVTPLGARTFLADCTVPSGNKAKIVEVKGAYQIGYLDEAFSLSYWWLDIPQMLKDFSEINPGEELQIKVELLWDAGAGICASCKTICECIFTLGIFGDDVRTMYFPYVFTDISPWQTGLVVTNLDAVTTPIANMEATFTLMDSTGKKFTYKKTDFQASVWPFMLDSIVANFDGTPKAGAGWLKVDTNFKVDGYQFVTDGVYGAGTLPRLPGWTAAP